MTSATTAATCSTPLDLINPRSRVDGEPPVFRETKHLFLDLPQFARAAARVDRAPDPLAAERPELLAATTSTSCEPRAVTRDLDWGIRIPVPGYEEHETSASTSGSTPSSATSRRRSSGRPTVETPDAWRDWWQNPEARHYYFMGKDNIVFHTRHLAERAARLRRGRRARARGARWSCPYDVVSTEYLTMEGRKTSASRGVGILVRDFLDRYDPDPLRYFLDRGGPRPRTPTSPGASSCAATTTSWSRSGATWSTAR